MILYNLTCAGGHEFEAWFRNGDAYADQAAKGAVGCPECGSVEIRKAPMAPSVSRGVARRRDALSALKQLVESRFENVGDRFADEARQIHYGEAEDRPIYGQATFEEVKELIEEEIPVLPLPVKVTNDA